MQAWVEQTKALQILARKILRRDRIAPRPLVQRRTSGGDPG